MESVLPVPFIAGKPVPPEKFLGRRAILEAIARRLTANGQSTSITGEPKSGKTSLLRYLEARGIQDTSYAAYGNSLRFTFVDCLALPQDCTWERFWRDVFYPFDAEWAGDTGPLGEAYRRACQQQFRQRALEDFFRQLKQTGQCCVLLLDELDALLSHPTLYHRDFLGGLRFIASNTFTGLALVSAGRMGVEYFNRKARKLGVSTSDYLNFVTELVLGPLEEGETDAVILQGGMEFKRLHGRLIRYWAGGQPFLLQAAASALWPVFTSCAQPTDAACKEAREQFYSQARLMLDEMWALWPPLMRCALTLIALPEMECVGKFYSVNKLRRLWKEEYLELECRWLARHGYICANASAPTGWRVGPQAIVWWLEEELRRLARDERTFEEWLRESRWEGIMTASDKERVKGVVSAVGMFARETLTAFLRAVGEGAGSRSLG